ncbi:MAG: hypothetical protein KGI75_07320 [Rhizobiaceae bacterium]|nr:hypothetical protein [Rhizobiaceae bacterium]
MLSTLPNNVSNMSLAIGDALSEDTDAGLADQRATIAFGGEGGGGEKTWVIFRRTRRFQFLMASAA